MALEYDTQKLYELYQSDPKIKGYINSLPTNRWLPELQRIYNNRHYNLDGDTLFSIAAVTMVVAGLLYLI